ncbi:MAG TPA: hypothetical protein GX394_05305 [Clostridiales bacterium]|jgi:hypothetical protein|nr:hypothetical protein [Clostridiales bacterium]
MDISFVRGGGLYTECALIKGYIRNNRRSGSWLKSELLPVICAGFALLRDSCVHFYRIECLLPRIYPA